MNVKPMGDCTNCGRYQHLTGGECAACYNWRSKNHGERRPHADLPPTLADRPEGALTSAEVVQFTGASYRQLDYWTRTGRIEPSIATPVDSGTVRWWSQDDADRIAVAVARIQWGMTVDAALRSDDPPLPAPFRSLVHA